MKRIGFLAAIAAGVLTLSGSAMADCRTDSIAAQESIRAGDPLMLTAYGYETPTLGGALSPSDRTAGTVAVSRIPIDATRSEKMDALEALEQAQIYGALGEENACQIALHEAFGHLNIY